MIHRWLSEFERDGHTLPFCIIEINECDITDFNEELKDFLAKLLLTHLEDLEELKDSFSHENSQILEDHIQHHVLCTDSHQIGKNIRQGDWAEVVSAEILEKSRGFILPIFKLRWKETKNQAMKGKADVVVCDTSGKKLKIVFNEVKSKIIETDEDDAQKICKSACKSLIDINDDPNPEIVNFVWKMLRLVPNPDYDLLELFDRARKHPKTYSKDFQIFFVFEKQFWKDEFLDILNNEKNGLTNLTANILLIESMKDLITDTYTLVPEIAKEVVYE